MNLNLVIGGAAGQGLQTLVSILGKIIFRSGYNIFITKNYMSRVRGGHNYMQIRFGDEKIHSPKDEIDILVGLTKETIDFHQERVLSDGMILFNEKLKQIEQKVLIIPVTELAQKLGNIKISNTIYIGAVVKLLGLSLDLAAEILLEYFGDTEVGKLNLQALQIGAEKVIRLYPLPKVTLTNDQLYMNGNQAIGLGAAMAGVKFYLAYPMSPSTSVMNYLAGMQDELGIVVEQAEDEIAAVNMALGASYIGIRAMTGTSGGGFALMNEGIGFAGVAELPIVITEVQRPGPATGLPTRTEQSDLLHVINVSQGEFPLIVIAPRDVEDCFYQTFKAFNLADKYQMPVIILSDQFLADSTCNVREFNLTGLTINRHWATEENLLGPSGYQRYKFTETGISPKIYPGQYPDQVVLVDSHEHNERGNITEDRALRIKMVDKRAQKLETFRQDELLEPVYIGDEDVDYLLVCWGSTFGAVKEAKDRLEGEKYRFGLLSFNHIWPLPTERLIQKSSSCQKMIVVENNATAQLAQLISSHTALLSDYTILKYDGRPFTGQEIYQRIIAEVISNGKK